ncbi:hypothetical protein AB0M61_14740 [Streptomyces sp. NPDC051642]|uniref:hypothetical protein n=1 Tax=Streptomyces sp. NPDC051642 TaxID=3154646 RepID=UPI003448045E
MISPALQQLFDAPPRDFGPTPLWWWSGAEVTREQLAWQLRRFADGGVHNLVVINLAPAGPAFGARTDDPPWFGEEWWDRFTDTYRIARDIGTRLWFYDQIGFSGANVQGTVTRRHPEATGRALRYRRATVTGGTVALRGAETLVAAYDLEGRRLPVAPDIPAAEGTDVRLVVAVPTAFDYLDPHAVGLLLDAVHHEYDRRVPEYGPDPVLNLGRVCGSVSVVVDGECVGEGFCPPYRFQLPGTAGRLVRLEVTVNNTLALCLAEATPPPGPSRPSSRRGCWGR